MSNFSERARAVFCRCLILAGYDGWNFSPSVIYTPTTDWPFQRRAFYIYVNASFVRPIPTKKQTKIILRKQRLFLLDRLGEYIYAAVKTERTCLYVKSNALSALGCIAVVESKY